MEDGDSQFNLKQHLWCTWMEKSFNSPTIETRLFLLSGWKISEYKVSSIHNHRSNMTCIILLKMYGNLVSRRKVLGQMEHLFEKGDTDLFHYI